MCDKIEDKGLRGGRVDQDKGRVVEMQDTGLLRDRI